ncbi:MAG: DnaD domain protein [Alicyclobacillus sp.]|nr:DnaD domain protein [Alicyclobacillus sp.]
MKPPERETANADFLSGPFAVIPYPLLLRGGTLGLSPAEILTLVQILACVQVEQREFLTPGELAERLGIDAPQTTDVLSNLVTRGFLAVGERLDGQGVISTYYDLKPLWTRLRGRDPLQSPVNQWTKNPVVLFEEEFGRPLSGLECEQIREWLERDKHPEWLVNEALREAVLANKYSFKYIDRILFEWQRHHIRTKQELEAYRESYREQVKARAEAAAARSGRPGGKAAVPDAKAARRDERYNAFYELFPDA